VSLNVVVGGFATRASVERSVQLSATARAAEEAATGQALFERGDVAGALTRYTEAVRLQPREARFHWAVGICEMQMGELNQAGAHLQEAVRLNPKFGAGQAWLGEWYLRQGMIRPALAATGAALTLEPGNVGFKESRAWVLEAAGELDAAWEIVRELVDQGKVRESFARLYGRLAPRYGDQERALAIVSGFLQRGVSPDNSNLYFTAADLLERAGRYDAAFSCAKRANELRQHRLHNPAELTNLYDRMIAYFTPERMKSLPRASYRSERPVFIVGMPRSGTSLVEQILSSHPALYGAGELDYLYHVFMGLLGMLRAKGEDYPGCLGRMGMDQLDGLAEVYLEPLVGTAPESAVRITDKMPMNFVHLGLIQMLLPESRIIYCRRDAMDTCVSCYMTDFSSGNEFKYDLGHLGHFHREQERLMAHWKSVVDLPILEVEYEKVIADAEGESKRMVEFLGLEWDERCLQFYDTKREVVTASVQQVRQPIYKSSMQRWRRYEKHLGELRAALEGSSKQQVAGSK